MEGGERWKRWEGEREGERWRNMRRKRRETTRG